MTLDAPTMTALGAILVAVLGSGGVGGYMIARVNARPTMAAALNAAVGAILETYQKELRAQGEIIGALRGDVEKLSRLVMEQNETITEQTETIEGLESHIDVLSEAMKQAGVPIPPRRKRSPSKDTA
jgi:peptidoglycan hydrolase CwlO-like protein